MNERNAIKIEMFYTLTCPNCKIMKRLISEVLPDFGDKFSFKKSLANSPIGMYKTMKLGVTTVPTLLIDNKIIFKSVPTKEELLNKLSSY
ncbi:MAG: hypothetical protein AUJ98_09905 [Bacteroidetes bacterium CG2_30_33_31]|nr:MAG: hypothetical protein AUJ98_09905 [Bacteroidetes bacterium CG2_30_33_31]